MLSAGLFAGEHVALYTSLVIDNQAYSANTASRAGGVQVWSISESQNSFISKYSQITENAAQSSGGIDATVDALIVGTTISNNQAERRAAGYIGNLGKTVTIQSTTISGNSGGGLVIQPNGQALIANSTISSNTGTGLDTGLQTRLESTIIAGNFFSDANPADRRVSGADIGELTGRNNLVFSTILGAPPPGTVVAIDRS